MRRIFSPSLLLCCSALPFSFHSAFAQSRSLEFSASLAFDHNGFPVSLVTGPFVPPTNPFDDIVPPRRGAPLAARISSASEVTVVSAAARGGMNEGFARAVSQREIESSAGTFGDPSRFLQTLAGVATDNDQRNDFLVRGGNPSENSFVIDNIEIPSINQLALSDTTGGFVSMLDGAAVQQITLHTDAYDARYDQRLSSVVEISTRKTRDLETHSTSEAGLAGVGGSRTGPLGHDGSFFVSARQSVLHLMTNDIGMNGVPKYRNAFLRAENSFGAHDSWWGISLTGVDSMAIHPSGNDNAETNPFDVLYSGWRNTTGMNWQHVFSAKSFGIASAAYAEQSQSLDESSQLQDGAQVYTEKTADRIATVKYDWTWQVRPSLTLTAGGRSALDSLNYAVAQPLGLQNPYSEDPTPLDASSLARRFSTFSSAAYVQAAWTLPHGASLVVAERGMQWALGGHAGSTAKAVLAAPLLGRLAHVGYAEYKQLPSTLYMLSFNNMASLKPIRSHQFTAGMDVLNASRARVTLEAYDKRYLDYPVAADYPQLSLANIADTFGQAFLMFPMVAQGKGLARGVELTVETRPASRLHLTGTLTYARNWYSGLDGVLRRGNYDAPLAANLTGLWQFGHGLTLSARYSASSGKVYTPDNLPLSIAQNRDVYDLSRINGVRADTYQRVDFRFEQTRKFGRGQMMWHLGLENALGSRNFYAQLWQPRMTAGGVAEQDQMPRFPDGGLKYSF